MRNDHRTNCKPSAVAKTAIRTPATTKAAPPTHPRADISSNGDIIIITSDTNIANGQQQYSSATATATPPSSPPLSAPAAIANDATRISIVENGTQPALKPARSRTSSRLVRFLKSTKQRKREERQQQQQQQQQLSQQSPAPTPIGGAALNGHRGASETAGRSNSSDTTTTTATGSTASGRGGGGAWRYCDITQCISFQDNIADVHHRKGRRLNGLQLPLHPLQLFGWLVLVLFGIAAYWLLIPAFAADWQGPLYGLITGLYIVHVVSHGAALLLDPADRELRRLHRNDRIVPEFDRTKHAHVIENGRCHLCNIRTTSQRTKHCSVCNKCVGKFDHHCKWLNHCVGSRNYVAFLMCVVSAVIATLVIVAAVLAQFAVHYLQPHWLAGGDASLVAATAGGVGVGVSVSGDIETIAFVLSENASGSGGGGGADVNVSAAGEALLNLTGVLLEEDFAGDNATASATATATASAATITLPTTFVEGAANETLGANFSLSATATTASAAAGNDNQDDDENDGRAAESPQPPPIAVIAGISVSDTIFLALLGALGLLAAITAGLLLHLCFFHIYISFLGLTTYEYIRNHRQAQEAKAKLSASAQEAAAAAALMGGGGGGGSPQSAHATGAAKRRSAGSCGQVYCCSSLRHPNAFGSGGGGKQAPALTKRGGLHCCADYREYHQTALKTYYVCSLLEETGGGVDAGPLASIAHISGAQAASDVDADVGRLRTFHCCSSFAASGAQRKLSTTTSKATLVSDLEAALGARRSCLQYTEQCTFCTFRIRSPSMAAKRAKCNGGGGGGSGSTSSCSSATSTRSISQTQSGEFNIASRTASAASTKVLGGAAAGSGGAGAGDTHPRCCMKAISKQQRWRRKWNCCSSVPDSPDVPNDIIATLAMRHHEQQQQQQQLKSTNATEIPVHFIRSVNGGSADEDGGECGGGGAGSPLPMAATKLKTTSPAGRAARNSRTWPVARFRHMMRMFNRYRRPRCRHHHHHPQPQQHMGAGGGISAAALMADQVKQNQIRPLQLRSANGCQQQHYDSSSPLPSSTSATLTPSSERSVTTPSSSLGGMQPIETILPTSVIRDDSAITYTSGMAPLPPVTITLPPALPPPTRRKIPNPTDLEELAETLAFAAKHNGSGGGGGGGGGGTSSGNRLPALQNVYRRQRRKHFLRTRSPTLSPIHESGLSNPTSPQPGRHHSGNLNNNSSTTISAGCSPVANAAAAVNNLCGSNSELIRKTASNSSLSSNSSSSN